MGFLLFMTQGILPKDQNFTTVPGAVSSATDSAASIRAFQYNPTTRGLTVHVVGEVESSFDHGRKSSIGATALQLIVTSTVAAHGVLVKASNSNGAGIIYLGNSDVDADSTDDTSGFELGAGESLVVPVDNVNKIYAIGSTTGLKVFWIVI